MCKCTPRTRSASLSQMKSQFLGHFLLLGGLDLEVYLNRLWRATTKKRSSTFFDEKSVPQTKSWLRLWRYINSAAYFTTLHFYCPYCHKSNVSISKSSFDSGSRAARMISRIMILKSTKQPHRFRIRSTRSFAFRILRSCITAALRHQYQAFCLQRT